RPTAASSSSAVARTRRRTGNPFPPQAAKRGGKTASWLSRKSPPSRNSPPAGRNRSRSAAARWPCATPAAPSTRSTTPAPTLARNHPLPPRRARVGGGGVARDGLARPWHGAVFDVTSGAHLCPPAQKGVAVYKVQIVGDEIQVDVG